MRVQRTLEEKKSLIAKINERVRTEDISSKQAIKDAGVTKGQYYAWIQEVGKGRSKPTKKRKAPQPALLTLQSSSVIAPPTPKTDGRLIVLIGASSDVQSALESFLGGRN